MLFTVITNIKDKENARRCMTSDDKIAELERKLTALRIESERLQEAHRLIEGDLLQLKASTDTPHAWAYPIRGYWKSH